MDRFFELFNSTANAVTLIGGVVAIFVLISVRRLVTEIKVISERLEQVLAPRLGIEGHLAMCAQAVECDPDGTCIVTDDGEIVLVNKRMEDISGYHRSELVGQVIEILVPDISRGQHQRERRGFTMNPSSRPMRGLELRHKQGVNLAVEIHLNRYMDSTGGFTIAKVRVPAG